MRYVLKGFLAYVGPRGGVTLLKNIDFLANRDYNVLIPKGRIICSNLQRVKKKKVIEAFTDMFKLT